WDFQLQDRIQKQTVPYWFPSTPLPAGEKTGEPIRLGLTHVHHFYTKRNLYVFAAFLDKTKSSHFRNHYWGAAKDCQSYATKMIKINVKRLLHGGGQFMGFVGGTLYLPSLNAEQSTLSSIANKVNK